jgi:hypothetical protein
MRQVGGGPSDHSFSLDDPKSQALKYWHANRDLNIQIWPSLAQKGVGRYLVINVLKLNYTLAQLELHE